MPGEEREKVARMLRSACAWCGFTCNALRTSSGGRLVITLPIPCAAPMHYSVCGTRHEGSQVYIDRVYLLTTLLIPRPIEKICGM